MFLFVLKHKYMKRPVSLKALTKNHLQQNYNKYKIISMHKVFYLKECINK